MRFVLIDAVLERTPERVRAVKQVSLAEEYLADHFPGFPILPGVLMLETLVQAGRLLLAEHTDDRLVLGEAKALRYGAMVRPGDRLEVEVELVRANDDGTFTLKGSGRVLDAGAAASDGDTAVSGRFTMRPIRLGAAAGA